MIPDFKNNTKHTNFQLTDSCNQIHTECVSIFYRNAGLAFSRLRTEREELHTPEVQEKQMCIGTPDKKCELFQNMQKNGNTKTSVGITHIGVSNLNKNEKTLKINRRSSKEKKNINK